MPVRTASRSVPVRPELRLVGATASAWRRPAAGSARPVPFALLLVVLLVATTVALLVLNTAIAVDSLKVTALRKENARRVEDVQRLERQVVEGSTPQQVAAQATAAGLVPAGTAGYLVVQPNGGATLRGTPAPAKPTAPASGSAAPTSSTVSTSPSAPVAPPAPASSTASASSRPRT